MYEIKIDITRKYNYIVPNFNIKPEEPKKKKEDDNIIKNDFDLLTYNIK